MKELKLYDMAEDWYRASRICKALGDPKKYTIVKILAVKDKLTPTQLSKRINRSINTVSTHLRTLRSLDIVRYQRRGKEAIYWLKDKKIDKVLKELEVFARMVTKKKI